MDWVKRIHKLDMDEAQARQLLTIENNLNLWRWFVEEADQVFRTSPKTFDSWKCHKAHINTAVISCRIGNISVARTELEKALVALKGLPMSQLPLI